MPLLKYFISKILFKQNNFQKETIGKNMKYMSINQKIFMHHYIHFQLLPGILGNKFNVSTAFNYFSLFRYRFAFTMIYAWLIFHCVVPSLWAVFAALYCFYWWKKCSLFWQIKIFRIIRRWLRVEILLN